MKKIISCIIAILFINLNSYSGEIVFDLSEYCPGTATLRSAFIPGWGQVYNEQSTKALILFGCFAASVCGAIYFNSEASKKYNDYKAEGLINGTYYDEYKQRFQKAEICMISAMVFYLYTLLDAYFTAKKRVRLLAFNFYCNPDNNGIYVNYQCKI
jgi:hypothetical protein